MPPTTAKRTKAAARSGRVIPSREMRQIAAEMVMKHVSLADVAARASINYHTLSAMLNGRVNRPRHHAALRTALASFPNP